MELYKNIVPLEEFMISAMHLTAVQSVDIMMALPWPDLSKNIPRVLSTYYQQNAATVAKTLYQTGWTDANNGTGTNGYGLNQSVRILRDYFGVKDQGEIIRILRDIGLDSLAVARQMERLALIGLAANWLPTYKQQGYTASDVAAWCKSTPPSSGTGSVPGGYGDIPSTITVLAQVTKYNLNEIALALRNAYKLSQSENLTSLTGNKRAGWTNAAILAANQAAYEGDPIQALLTSLKQNGVPAIQTMNTLKSVFAITEPMQLAEYLDWAGYEENDVLGAISRMLDDGNMTGVFSVLSEVIRSIYPDTPNMMGVILRAAGIIKPSEAVRVLKLAHFELLDIALVLRDVYHRTNSEAIGDLTRWGYTDTQIFPVIQEVFCGDSIMAVVVAMKIQYQNNQMSPKNSAGLVAAMLKNSLSVRDPMTIADCLHRADYKRDAVLYALAGIIKGRGITEQINIFMQIQREIYHLDEGITGEILDYLGLHSLAKTVYVLQDEGYSLGEIITVLKDTYGVSAVESIDLLSRESGKYEKRKVVIGVEEVYGRESTLPYIQYRKDMGDSAVFAIHYLVDYFGITDAKSTAAFLKNAGYAKEDIMRVIFVKDRNALGEVLKDIYGLTEPSALATELKNLDYFSIGSICGMVMKLFQEINIAGMTFVLKDAGYPLDNDGMESVVYWLLYDTPQAKDDALAAVLGPKNGIGIKDYRAAAILAKRGYDMSQTALWLQKDGYSPSEIFYGINDMFSSDHNINTYKSLKTLGYGVDEIAKAAVDYYRRTLPLEGIAGSSWLFETVLKDLHRAGYNVAESTVALVRENAPIKIMPTVMRECSLTWSSEAQDNKLKLSAEQILNILNYAAVNTPNRTISIKDIAEGFVVAGDLFTKSSVVGAIISGQGQVLGAAVKIISDGGISVGDGISEGVAFGILKEAGWSIDTALEAAAEKCIGLFSAFVEMLIAGYSFEDTVSGLWNNRSYHFAIGVTVAMSFFPNPVVFNISDTWILNKAANMAIYGAVKKVAVEGLYELASNR